MVQLLALQILKKVEAEASRKATEARLLALIVPFNKDRLDYYWSALLKDLPLCVEHLEVLEGSTSELLLCFIRIPPRSSWTDTWPFRRQNHPERIESSQKFA
jgi:hypothetical protein